MRLASFVGVSPIFGALVAGILAGDLHGESARAKQTIHSFSYAFFIPLYFAVVGLRLDLVRHFEPDVLRLLPALRVLRPSRSAATSAPG